MKTKKFICLHNCRMFNSCRESCDVIEAFISQEHVCRRELISTHETCGDYNQVIADIQERKAEALPGLIEDIRALRDDRLKVIALMLLGDISLIRVPEVIASISTSGRYLYEVVDKARKAAKGE